MKPMGLSDASKAGFSLFAGVTQFGIFMIVAETLYPNYNVANNYISDLGPPCVGPPNCPSQTSWWVFDGSIVLMGLCILVSAFYLNRYFRWKPATALILLTGIGAIGVGVFNETAPYSLHGLMSLLTFLASGLSAIVGFWLQKPPMSYLSVILGVTSLGALLLYAPGTGADYGAMLGIGVGGLERMIVYPVIFWGLAFGGHLMALDKDS